MLAARLVVGGLMIRSTADGTLQSCDMRTQILAQPLLTFLHARGPMVLRLAPTSLTTHRPTSLIPPLTSLPWKLANDKAETKYVIVTGMYVSSKSFFLFSLANTDPSSLPRSPLYSREWKHWSHWICPLTRATYQFCPWWCLALHAASPEQNVLVVKPLIEQGADVKGWDVWDRKFPFPY